MIFEKTMNLFLPIDVGSIQVLIIFILKPIFLSYAMPCPDSLKTMITVLKCPSNVIEWNTRATLFNCSSFEQTCVEPKMFEYHCVLTEKMTHLVEVCAPAKFIQGQNCAEFNTIGCLIQESQVKCNDGDLPCPGAYRSTTTYNYQSCFETLRHTTTKKYGTTQAPVEDVAVQHEEEVSDKFRPEFNDRILLQVVPSVVLFGYSVIMTTLFVLLYMKIKRHIDSTKRKDLTLLVREEMQNEPSITLNEE
uniref:Uncharacterized protein LOC111134251 n=1 Tax=Crassostrea virginica TaxID=6565 RepID=A0A8B8EDV7_CRAVI|nr:uncharacterized protein LOC111134251 [Crassostrea virginica]